MEDASKSVGVEAMRGSRVSRAQSRAKNVEFVYLHILHICIFVTCEYVNIPDTFIIMLYFLLLLKQHMILLYLCKSF